MNVASLPHVMVAVAANQSQAPKLSSAVWALLVAFLAATGVLLFKLYRRFA